MSNKCEGTCTNCGAKNVFVTGIDDETALCDKCIDELDYTLCDECGEYWNPECVSFYELSDGRTICMHCAENLLDDEEITEDDVEDIWGGM